MNTQNIDENQRMNDDGGQPEPESQVQMDPPIEGSAEPVLPYNQGSMGEGPDQKVQIEINSAPSIRLLDQAETERFRANWARIQGHFVDDPRQSVTQADELVGEVIGKISEQIAKNHGVLVNQWMQGNTNSTEALRLTLKGYRAFLNQLLRQDPV